MSSLTGRFGILLAGPDVIQSASTNRTTAVHQKGTIMSRISQVVRNHRDSARTRREINKAIDGAATPAVRDELRTMAQAQGFWQR